MSASLGRDDAQRLLVQVIHRDEVVIDGVFLPVRMPPGCPLADGSHAWRFRAEGIAAAIAVPGVDLEFTRDVTLPNQRLVVGVHQGR